MFKFHFLILVLSCTLVFAGLKGAGSSHLSKRAAGKAPAKAAAPAKAKGAAKGKITASEFEKEAIKRISAAAEKLSDISFSFDPILFQIPDKINSETKYRFPGENETEKQDIYVRKVDDSGKTSIVFSTEEDHLEWKNKKRVYIVLKKNKEPKSTQNEYFTAVAYLRDAGDKDKNPLKISGGSYKIEWDLWDDHFIPGGSTMTLNSIFCTSSVILPCLFSDDGKDGIVKAAKRFEPKKIENNEELNNIDKVVVDTGNAEDSYDMYRDVDLQKVMEGRGYDTTYTTTTNDGNPGVLGSVARGVSGIVCSVFGGCGNNRKTTTTTINIDAQMSMGGSSAGGYNPYGYTAAGPAPTAYYGAAPGAYYGAPQAGYPVAYGRKKRESEAATSNMLDFPGWKTQYVVPEKGVYLKNEDLPFYGFGNCPSKPVTDAELEEAKTGEQLVNYYLKVLRSDCVELLQKQLMKLLEIDALRVKDKTLVVNEEVKQSGNPKFTLHETIFSQTALEMDAFTTNYIKLLHDKKAEKPTTPDGTAPISRSVNLAVQLLLSYVAKSREIGRAHMIAKTRHAITGARYAFSKLAQDQQNMQPCADCQEDMNVNLSDRHTIMGLIQYFKYGLREIDIHNKDAIKSFKTFFTKNKAFITKRVEIYS